MSNKTGGQAFPKQQWEYDGQNNVLQYQENGMTLRDYFAAKAMQGRLSNPDWLCSDDRTATEAYQMADAMLRAREAS
ncbi:hypothetical protein OUHCRE2_42030 [Enterobacter asburiae]|uniref:hypothetical protein n=1 Tax=Citrobacter freundii TaxID=546 RepID=UPI0008FCF9DB|nr:hypothetical protein [Citrobacter freundii]HBO0722844.1 hypothetical protein [Enterobacter asburiae]EKV4069232.1 hypothetical protein [Citrobacter freundii]OIZ49843.1 hypothetical protein BEH75_25430 [Citrobacter freundii]OIZ54264.1 hypothetical protein BEH71_10215 [Citrobacter freundii]HCA3852083.1 hypothetical protein [Enterobacter asburiae]